MKRNLKKLVVMMMVLVMGVMLVACGDKETSSDSGKKRDLSPEEEKLVGRWSHVDFDHYVMDIYSDGTGWINDPSENYEGIYIEWEYNEEEELYYIYTADEGIAKKDKNGLRVYSNGYGFLNQVAEGGYDGLNDFVEEGTEVEVLNNITDGRWIRVEDCTLDQYGYAEEDHPSRSLPEYEDGKLYNVPYEKGKDSIKMYKEDSSAYRDSLVED